MIDGSPSAARQLAGRPRKLKLLDAAVKLDDLGAPPGNGLELKVGEHGPHSIRVNDQYRVTFRWENGHPDELRAEECHRDLHHAMRRQRNVS